MSVNNSAVAEQIKTVLEALAGIGHVQIGAPESVPTRVGAYVSMGSQSTSRKASAVMNHETRFFVLFMYRVDKKEESAESSLIALVDQFTAALHADLTLNGAVKALEVNSLAADEPDYQIRAGKEFREYPMVVTVTQHGSYAVNP